MYKTGRIAECLAIFVGFPLLFYWNLLPIPKIAGLGLVMLLCLGLLWGDSSYHFKHLKKRPPARAWKRLSIKSAVVAVALIILAAFLQPQKLFVLPRQQPLLWLLIMALYPLLSALPQELVYRAFFFHRYRQFFRAPWLMVLSSACVFSFLHIVYDNIWAPVLAFIGGILFAETYQKTKSLYFVVIEHAIYGCLVFTVGLGIYFFEGF